MSLLIDISLLKAPKLFSFVIILGLINHTCAFPHKHEYFVNKLDEYLDTIKCIANILEDIAPKMNTPLVCCGLWMMQDWLETMVLTNCYDHSYDLVHNSTHFFFKHMEENCYDYPRGSLKCK